MNNNLMTDKRIIIISIILISAAALLAILYLATGNAAKPGEGPVEAETAAPAESADGRKAPVSAPDTVRQREEFAPLGAGVDGAVLISTTSTDFNRDSDGDGVTDGEELRIYKTDPESKDTDKDGYDDGSEIRRGYDPLKK